MTAILDISRMISISISRNQGCWQDLESEDPGTGPFLQQLRLSVLSALGREGRATWAGWGSPCLLSPACPRTEQHTKGLEFVGQDLLWVVPPVETLTSRMLMSPGGWSCTRMDRGSR